LTHLLAVALREVDDARTDGGEADERAGAGVPQLRVEALLLCTPQRANVSKKTESIPKPTAQHREAKPSQAGTDAPSSGGGAGGGGCPMLAADEELISHDRPGRGTPEPNLYSLLANPPETASIAPTAFLKSAAFCSETRRRSFTRGWQRYCTGFRAGPGRLPLSSPELGDHHGTGYKRGGGPEGWGGLGGRRRARRERWERVWGGRKRKEGGWE
jgi:hypothetical protein